MPALTPTFVGNLETNMQIIRETAYLDLTKKLWWDKVMTRRTISTGRQILVWPVNTAQIEDQGQGGNIAFEDMQLVETEFRPTTAGKGLKLRRQQFEDLDGNGVDLASEWVQQIGAQEAYWPQKLAVTYLKNGALAASTGYDNLPFFSASHPVNPSYSNGVTFSNLITGVPLIGVTVDTALANLQTVYARIAGVKAQNGVDPRFLRPKAILCSPTTFPRAVQLTNAKFIAQAASSGGGSADITALQTALGFGEPVQADELAGYESDSTYFVIAESMTNTQLGGLIYLEREPFSIRYYTGRGGGNGVDAILDRADELEWHTSGRNAVGYAHPYHVFKCTA